jgi:branched-chain amino acid transport system substrate-binding protein
MRKSVCLLIAVALLLSLVGSACGPTPAPEKVVETVVVTKEVQVEVTKEVEVEVVVTPTPLPPPEEVLIGAIYPLTGGLAATGEDLKAGVELAVEIVNGEYPDLNLPLAAEAGLPNFGGAKVKVIFGDHEASAEKGMSEAERLITEEGVVALAGCYNSSVTLTASQAAERLGIPFLNPESTSPMLTERGFKYFFRTTPHDKGLAENFFKFLDWLKEEGFEVKKVAILNENTLWGTDVATLETEFAEQYGYELVESIAYSKEATDMTSEVQKLKASGAEVVLQSSYVSDAVLSMKTYKDLDYNLQGILAMDAGFIVSEFVETLGDDANYIVSREVWTLDLATAKPMINDVNELYKEQYGRNMEGNSARAFTGVLTLCDALNRAGSLVPEDIQKALLETDIPADMTIMPWGVKFDPVSHQNVLGTGIIVQIQDGEYYTVWPPDVASKEVIWPMPTWEER